ncbi:MAG: integrin alpha, partial [Pseudomonadota bacterium]
MSDFDAVFSVTDLDGSNGFRVDGFNASPGNTVSIGESASSVGDINGDGIDDFIIGSGFADPNGSGSGLAYVVFGTGSGFDPTIDLASLDGTDGFQIPGQSNNTYVGRSVSGGGDVNGDGKDDLIVGATRYDAPGGLVDEGSAFVLFGRTDGFDPVIDLSTIGGATGFRLDGEGDGTLGQSVSLVGDINGDGFDDLIVSDTSLDLGGINGNQGAVYVVFGSAFFADAIRVDSLNGTNGFRLSSDNQRDFVGDQVSAGDINGDGFDDLIVGAEAAGLDGEAYVVFGAASGFTADINPPDLDGTNGFRINGEGISDSFGSVVSTAGDINGDGFDDLIIGDGFADPFSGADDQGTAYVIFGQATGFAPELDVADLNGMNGFRMTGPFEDGYAGFSVSDAGDINGDGFDDIVIGAYGDSAAVGDDEGAAYVVFGKVDGFDADIDLGALDGTDGFRLEGANASDFVGSSISSAGDVNGDGFDDLLIGANGLDYGGRAAGGGYVVFGRAPTEAVTRIGSEADQTIRGGEFNDFLAGRDGDDRLFGDRGRDELRGNDGDDTLNGNRGNDALFG